MNRITTHDGGGWTHAPLQNVHVLEVSHTLAAAHAGKLLQELGANVSVLDRITRDCGGCDIPPDVAAQLDVGKEVVWANRSPARKFDIVITDEDCCLRSPVADGASLASHRGR